MDFSIVLEWENALTTELKRTKEMLIMVHRQCFARSETFELIVLHNPEQVNGDFISWFIEETIQKHNLPRSMDIRIKEAPKAHYFQLKNYGIKESSGQSVIILDSDVIPLEDWFNKILSAHQNHPDALISGLSFIDHRDFMGKAFALNWFFPFPPIDDQIIEVDLIHSNNFIGKRQLLLDNPYPKLDDGVTRGSDNILWKRMIEKGIKLYYHHGARASHPAPTKFSHFYIRGMGEGRDLFLLNREKEFFRNYPTIHFVKFYFLLCIRVLKNTFWEGHRVKLKPWEKPAIAVTMLFYYQLFLAGGLVARFFPSYSKTVWQI